MVFRRAALLCRLIPAVLLALTALGCGGDTPTAPPAGPFMQCPADVRIESPDGGAVAVTYSLPAASGGTPPYTVSCNPPSGTSIGIGTSSVTCNVSDARGRTAVCSFNVTVSRPPRLRLSRFLAFGDSLTEGVTNETPTFRLVDRPNSYPQQLDGLLRAYFRGQSLIVLNDGLGGEMITGSTAHSPGAQIRLPVSVGANQPQVVLLMEGTNDITADPASNDDLQSLAIDGLRRMIDYVQARGLPVFVATIPPMNPQGTKRVSPESAALVPGYNTRVRALVQAEGAVLVDVYAAISARPELLSSDGLHLNVLGYGVVAESFFDAIKRELEIR